jgi:hypothetical protein
MVLSRNTPVARPKSKKRSLLPISLRGFVRRRHFQFGSMRTLFSAASYSQPLRDSSGTTIVGCLVIFLSAVQSRLKCKAAVSNRCLPTFKAGYKTYIKGIRQDANRASKTQIRRKPWPVLQVCHRRYLKEVRRGDIAMDGHLSLRARSKFKTFR